MRLAIIGCGLIGEKRRRALGGGDTLAVACDVNLERAQNLTRSTPGTVATADWRQAVKRADVDAVIVATTNDWLAPVTLAALQAGQHVVVEKTNALWPGEMSPCVKDAGHTR